MMELLVNKHVNPLVSVVEVSWIIATEEIGICVETTDGPLRE